MEGVTGKEIFAGAAISAGVGTLAGCLERREAKKSIGEDEKALNAALDAQKKGPDEKAIREEIKGMQKYFGFPEDFFEKSVQRKMDFEKKKLAMETDYRTKILESTKKFYKNAGKKVGIVSAVGTALILGCIAVVDKSCKKSKEA